METPIILTHIDLKLLIEQVRELKEVQEKELKNTFNNFTHALSPVEVAKSTLHTLVQNKEVQIDLVKGAMTLSANFIIGSFFNRNNSIQGFLSTILLERATSTIISAKAPQIIIGITDLILGQSKNQEELEDL